MELVLRHNGEEKKIELFPEILQALWDGETELVPACVGWGQLGILSVATPPDKVEGPNPDKPWSAAGFLKVTLTEEVKASEETLKKAFILYGTRHNKT